MTDFNDLQQIWQGQSTQASVPSPQETISGIRRFKKRIRRERRSIIHTFLVTFIVLTGSIWLFPKTLYVIGIVTAIGGMSIVLVQFWKNKTAEEGEHFQLTNQQFLEKNIQMLKERRAITSRYMPWYAFLLILGLNISYIDLLQVMDLNLWMRIGIHVVFTLLMWMIFHTSVQNHLKKFDEQVGPLLKSLEKIKAENNRHS